MQLLKQLVILTLLVLSYSECWSKINTKTLFNTYSVKDSIYIKDDLLIVERDGIKYEFNDLVIDAASVSTSIKYLNSKDNFILLYEYTASYMKRKEIVYFAWKKGNLMVSKIIYVLFDSRQGKELEFSWTCLVAPKKDGQKINYDYILDQSIVNHSYINIKECKLAVQFSSKKAKFIDKICSLKRIIRIPVFYSDGTLVGNYLYQQEKNFSMTSSFDGDPELKFTASNNITIANVSNYNNIAYFLEQSSTYLESTILLECIIQKFPDRTVAYINLGDAYFGLKNISKAKEAYNTYITQMKKSSKESKIPKRVYDIVK